jgi:peptidyl-prolyl cis-trans isomerase A (cyclophilin A)
MRILRAAALFAAAGWALSGCGPTAASPAAPAPAVSAQKAPAAAAPSAALLEPSKANETAPDVFKARLTTTEGDIVVEVHRAWAPRGADRFYNLVKVGFYDGTEFFRVLDGFMAQVGINGDPAVSAKWRDADIQDDPSAGQSNRRGMVTFAHTSMPNSRGTQIFINFRDNSSLDGTFQPFGKVVEGDAVLDRLYREYGEGAPSGPGPDQGRIQAEGNAYLKAQFPNLDSIKTARLE